MCARTYQMEGTYRRHFISHFDSRLYACEICQMVSFAFLLSKSHFRTKFFKILKWHSIVVQFKIGICPPLISFWRLNTGRKTRPRFQVQNFKILGGLKDQRVIKFLASNCVFSFFYNTKKSNQLRYGVSLSL